MKMPLIDSDYVGLLRKWLIAAQLSSVVLFLVFLMLSCVSAVVNAGDAVYSSDGKYHWTCVDDSSGALTFNISAEGKTALDAGAQIAVVNNNFRYSGVADWYLYTISSWNDSTGEGAVTIQTLAGGGPGALPANSSKGVACVLNESPLSTVLFSSYDASQVIWIALALCLFGLGFIGGQQR